MTGDGQAGVLLAHSQRLFRDAVRSVLDHEDDLVVVAEASDGMRAVAEAVRCRPDVVVSEQDLESCDGVTLTRILADRLPESHVILLVDRNDEDALVEAIEAGARACVRRDVSIIGLTETIRGVVRGETIVPAPALGGVFARLIRRRDERDLVARLLATLTPREREVLRRLADGESTSTIAQALEISKETARTHVHRIMRKLQVHSRIGAVMLVTRTGLIGDSLDLDDDIRGAACAPS